mmetsp:Transcript_98793/g.283825  ORF Transcript_98793/g.283825 Transcript_98793/m.283825 type:complete len:237 (-) Transcript_98793:124-834(-)
MYSSAFRFAGGPMCDKIGVKRSGINTVSASSLTLHSCRRCRRRRKMSLQIAMNRSVFNEVCQGPPYTVSRDCCSTTSCINEAPGRAPINDRTLTLLNRVCSSHRKRLVFKHRWRRSRLSSCTSGLMSIQHQIVGRPELFPFPNIGSPRLRSSLVLGQVWSTLTREVVVVVIIGSGGAVLSVASSHRGAGVGTWAADSGLCVACTISSPLGKPFSFSFPFRSPDCASNACVSMGRPK